MSSKGLIIVLLGGALLGCSPKAIIRASPDITYPVMLNEARSIDGRLLGSWTGSSYTFNSKRLASQTSSTSVVGNMAITTTTSSLSESEANPEYYYERAIVGRPSPILIQQVYCGTWIMLTVGGGVNSSHCRVDGAVR